MQPSPLRAGLLCTWPRALAFQVKLTAYSQCAVYIKANRLRASKQANIRVTRDLGVKRVGGQRLTSYRRFPYLRVPQLLRYIRFQLHRADCDTTSCGLTSRDGNRDVARPNLLGWAAVDRIRTMRLEPLHGLKVDAGRLCKERISARLRKHWVGEQDL